jgi:hypothetical protein
MSQISDQNYSSLQEGNAQIISDIGNLQKIEKTMFSTLQQNANTNTLSETDKQSLIQKINDLSQMRSNMYKTIDGLNSFYTNNLNSSANTLAQQTAAIAVVERELNESKKRLEQMQDYKTNKLRLVQINNYYGERYAYHSHLMKIVICMFIPILILTILRNKEFIPLWLFSLLVVIIGIIGAVSIFYVVKSMIMRDTMVYDEYNWQFDPNSAPKASASNSAKDPWASNVASADTSCSSTGACVGQDCCSAGYTYYAGKNKCLPTGTESFISEIFTKYAKAAENKKPDYTMGDTLPISYAST